MVILIIFVVLLLIAEVWDAVHWRRRVVRAEAETALAELELFKAMADLQEAQRTVLVLKEQRERVT